MKIDLTIEASPRSWRRRRLLVVVTAVLAIAIPAAVWASHDFADVPSDRLFHTQISAIAGAGITTGCGAPAARTYCPEEFVRRDAMAAFMHRGFGRVAKTEMNLTAVATSDTVTLGTLTITPGLPSGALAGAKGFIKADAAVVFWIEGVATGCPCMMAAQLLLDGQPMHFDWSYVMVRVTDDIATVPLTGVGEVTTSGPHTITVEVVHFRGIGTVTAWGNATAAYYPFGSTGTNVLGTDSVPPSGDRTPAGQ